jgi:ABC-type transporter Mla subunit MlaD
VFIDTFDRAVELALNTIKPGGVILQHRLDAIEPALDAIESALDAIESALDAIESALDAIESVLDAIESVLDAIESVLNAVETLFVPSQTRFDEAETFADFFLEGLEPIAHHHRKLVNSYPFVGHGDITLTPSLDLSIGVSEDTLVAFRVPR